MKRSITLALMLSAATISCMEQDADNNNTYNPAPLEAYPEGMGYVPEDELFDLIAQNPMPEDIEKSTKLYLDENPNVKALCSLNTLLPEQQKTKPNPGRSNYAFKNGRTFIKIAGFQNIMRHQLSSSGYDPYSEEVTQKLMQEAIKLQTPRFQHLSTIVTMELLKRAQSSTIKQVESWAYNLPDKLVACNDENYIIVQKDISETHIQLSQLDKEDRSSIIPILNELDLEEMYRVLKYANLWNPSKDNLWINRNNTQEFAYPDGEKPNNEGVGKDAKWKVSIFGQDINKAKHNIRNPWDGGHRIFENLLTEYVSERVTEWNTYYESDPDFP